MKKLENRYFIHDHELEKYNMDNEEKMKHIRDHIEKEHSNNTRLNIAKELLIAQLNNPTLIAQYKTTVDMVDDAIALTDLLLERIEQ